MNKFKIAILILVGISTVASCLSFDSNPYKQGKNLYIQNCQNCHQEDGKALQGLIPPLAESDYLSENRDKLACIIRLGIDSAIVVNGVTYNHVMPANDILTPTQIANVINYINSAWGNNEPYMSYEEVVASLKACGTE